MTETQIAKPDILDCLANLSSDEVFTPPSVVNAMLDMLPQELFANPKTKFLDPFTKSGVFLREIAKRLDKGLAKMIPDNDARIRHIFANQVYGIAITQLTALFSRRSLYCNKDVNNSRSTIRNVFRTDQGNIGYHPCKHTWKNGSCTICGASKKALSESADVENYAYPFLHDEAFMKQAQELGFDVVIGNPPYQMSSNDDGIQATPIYQKFVQQALRLNPRYLTMIIPARWYAGGMGMQDFREIMLNSSNIRVLHDFPKSRDCLDGVDIAGGICYFLWDREHKGECEITNHIGEYANSSTRLLNEYPIFVRDNVGVGIVKKALKGDARMLSDVVCSISPFGIPTSVRGVDVCKKGYVTLRSSKGLSYLPVDHIPNTELLNKYKVIIGQLNPDRAGVNNSKDGRSNVTTRISICEPNEVTTATYLVLGSFTKRTKAENYVSYIKTRFVRYLVFITLSSMHITKSNFCFVPVQDFSKPWTDAELYKKYKLTKDEISFIESMIRPME